MSPKNFFRFGGNTSSLSSSEYSNMSNRIWMIPSLSDRKLFLYYQYFYFSRLFNRFKMMTRMCMSFYFNSDIFSICLFFYISISNNFMLRFLPLSPAYLGLSIHPNIVPDTFLPLYSISSFPLSNFFLFVWLLLPISLRNRWYPIWWFTSTCCYSSSKSSREGSW